MSKTGSDITSLSFLVKSHFALSLCRIYQRERNEFFVRYYYFSGFAHEEKKP